MTPEKRALLDALTLERFGKPTTSSRPRTVEPLTPGQQQANRNQLARTHLHLATNHHDRKASA